MTTYIKIIGWVQKASRDRKVKWDCILMTNRAAEGERGIVILEE